MHRAAPIHSSRKREATSKAVVLVDPIEQQQEHYDLDELTQRLNSWQYEATPRAADEAFVDRTITATTTGASSDDDKKRKLGNNLLLRKQDSVKTMDEVNRILGTLIAHQPTMRQRARNDSTGKLDEDAAAQFSALDICSSDWSWDSSKLSSDDEGEATIVTFEGYCLQDDEDDAFSAFTLHVTLSVASSCNSSVTWHEDQHQPQPGGLLEDFLDWEMP